MILVDWKGDDEQPFVLTFDRHLTMVHLDPNVRAALVRQIASVFEAQLAPFADPAATDAAPLNVMGPADLEWLLEDVELLPASETPSDETTPTEAWFDSDDWDGEAADDPVHDEFDTARIIDLETATDNGSADPLVAATSRELVARDDFLHAEAERDRLRAESGFASDPAATPEVRAGVDHMARLRDALTERLAQLEAPGRPATDYSAVAELLGTVPDPEPRYETVMSRVPRIHVQIDAHDNAEALAAEASVTAVEPEPLIETRPNPDYQYWKARFHELRNLVDAARREEATTALRPPAWLIEQSRRELELATSSLESFADHDSDAQMGFLELEARRRYTEAVSVWEELERYGDDADPAARNERSSVIASLTADIGAFLGASFADESSALDALETALRAMPAELVVATPEPTRDPQNVLDHEPVAPPAPAVTVEVDDHPYERHIIAGWEWPEITVDEATAGALRAALAAAGVAVPVDAADAQVATVAQQWVWQQRQGEANTARRSDERQQVKADLARVDATLRAWNITLASPEIEAAERRVDETHARYQAAEASVVELRRSQQQADADPRPARAALVAAMTSRLTEAVSALREAVGDAIPLLMDATFDGIEDPSRDAMFDALAAVGREHQVVYFTSDASVAGWAAREARPGVAFITPNGASHSF